MASSPAIGIPHFFARSRRLTLLATVWLACAWAAPAWARDFALDGSLSEWTDADRLDVQPGFGVDGYQLYGYQDNAAGKFRIAVQSSVAIGAATTLWIDTDRDSATGYQVWGFLCGAEFNINLASDGSPHLYSGADGQTWLVGPLSHGYNADHTVLELEFTQSMVSATTPIRLWLDINNSVFLPSWYGIGGYTVDDVGIAPPPTTPDGPIALDGSLADWVLVDRLDRQPGMGVLGYELYGRADASTYYVALKALPPAAGIGPRTTFWLNTDRQIGTGFQVWGIAVGAEFNVNLAADGTPHLYWGADAEHWITGPLPYAKSADGNVIEIAIDRNLLGATTRSLDVSVDVNDWIFLPADFTGPGYTLFHPEELPPRAADRPHQVGIVYSATTAAHYFGNKAYPQLFAAMQQQAMLAGIPFVLLNEDALTDVAQIKDLDALLIPYMANVDRAKLRQVEDTLVKAIYHYGVGVITSGNFLTNDETGASLPGDAYARMKRLLGVTLDSFFGPLDHTLQVAGTHPMLRGYAAAGESLATYVGGYETVFRRHDSVATQVGSSVAATAAFPAVWAIQSSARSVHFGSTGLLGDSDLGWRAMLWTIYGDAPFVGLQLTRAKSMFIGRCDMDQSQYVDEAPVVYNKLLPILQKWKTNYNFVGSNYVNVGNDAANGMYTNWAYSGPMYQSIRALGNEIGTHSYTHPEYTSTLTQAQLEFEFKDSRDVIGAQLGITLTGAAVPGNPETLGVDTELNKYFDYATADYSGFGAGYHGAMGHLTPGFQMIYLAPNVYFDFTMIGFLKYTAAQALTTWKTQYDALVRHAPSPFVVWGWHDYGPTRFDSAAYTEAMFTNFLAYVHTKGGEFVTGAQAAGRIRAFEGTAIRTSQVDANTLQVTVDGSAALGAFSLQVESPDGRAISSVDGWPAFSGNRVLIGEAGGSYTVRLGAAVSGPRLSALPMRASLQSVSGTASSLDFAFVGVGVVDIIAPAGSLAATNDCGATAVLASGVLKLTFAADGQHTCHVQF